METVFFSVSMTIENEPLPESTSWADFRLITFNGSDITLLLRNDEKIRKIHFNSMEEMRAQIETWFKRTQSSDA